jgi:hypothetical protein
MNATAETSLEIYRNSIESRSTQPPTPGSNPTLAPTAVVVGVLCGFGEEKQILVNFPENKSGYPVQARSTIVLDSTHVGKEVLLAFEHGLPAKPIVIGCIQAEPIREPKLPVEVKLDGRQVMLSAEKEIVLQCGKASITLTRAGKILINGEYLLSRSSGVNRIKGGSVQIN